MKSIEYWEEKILEIDRTIAVLKANAWFGEPCPMIPRKPKRLRRVVSYKGVLKVQRPRCGKPEYAKMCKNWRMQQRSHMFVHKEYSKALARRRYAEERIQALRPTFWQHLKNHV